ncbi:MAG: hypothetical protein JO307_28540 [Bryobacterales bacterium]|nr:hypothetical protein [Bryobacterales bacterium]
MRGRLHLYLIQATLLIPLASWGQDRPSGFDDVTPLGLSSGYDSNFIVGSQTLSDNVSIITSPAWTWGTSTRRSSFSLEYQPEFEIFSNYSHLNTVNHTGMLTYTHRFNSQWTLNAGDAFFSTMDPSRTLANSLILFPWGRFDQNTFYTEIVDKLNKKTNVTLRLDSVYTTVAVPQLQGGLDNVTGAGTLTVDRSVSAHQQVSVSYTFMHTVPLDPQPFRTLSNIQVEMLGYSYLLPRGFIFRLTGGGTQGGRQSGFTGSANVEKRVGDIWINAGYQRYLGFFTAFGPLGQPLPGQIVLANGVTPNIRYDTFSLRASGRLTRRIGIDGNAQKAINGTDISGLKIRSLVGQLRVDYRINDRFVLFARVEHYGQNLTFFLPEAISRNRYFGGVEIALSKSAGPNGARFRRGAKLEDSAVVPAANAADTQ